MKIKNFVILLLIAPIFLYSCSESSSNDDKLVLDALIEEGLSKKDAKCILKETKPLVEKELWAEYVAAEKKDGEVNEHLAMDKVMSIGMSFMVGYGKCGVPLK